MVEDQPPANPDVRRADGDSRGGRGALGFAGRRACPERGAAVTAARAREDMYELSGPRCSRLLARQRRGGKKYGAARHLASPMRIFEIRRRVVMRDATRVVETAPSEGSCFEAARHADSPPGAKRVRDCDLAPIRWRSRPARCR